MRNLRTRSQALIVFSMLLVLARAGGAEGAWRQPVEPFDELVPAVEIEPLRPEVDPCGCLRELRACLIAATASLGRCLSWANTPARQALCYFKFELDVLLCLDRIGVCEQTCVP